MSNTKAAVNNPGTPSFQTRAHQVRKEPLCQAGCPNSGDVRGWIGLIAQHEKNGLTLDEAYDKAWELLADRNPLPASISRICPHPCEAGCMRTDKDGAVSINALERFLGDWGLSRSLPLPMLDGPTSKESIGVIGSGPASLSFAYQMARRGYAITMYEKHKLPGGMLRYAIPDFRLPYKTFDREVERLLNIGISFVPETTVGSSVHLDELRERHDLLFLGLGAQVGRDLGIPGEDGSGVIAGIDFLRERKKRKPRAYGTQIVVVGGGNTAIDAARCARRDGAEVTVMYRRSETEMPAAAHEVADARKEGVKFSFLSAPTRIIRQNGHVAFMEVQTMRLGEPDQDGRRRPEPVPGLTQSIPVATVIVAIAQTPDWRGFDAITATEQWLRDNVNGQLADDLWAGGDNLGPGIASRAIAHGRIAAESVHARLRGLPSPEAMPAFPTVRPATVCGDYYAEQQRAESPRRPEEDWLKQPDKEINRTLGYEEAFAESKRCMSCGLCFDCQRCFMFCNQSGFTRVAETSPGNYFALALDACEGCGKCIEICPCGYLEARKE